MITRNKLILFLALACGNATVYAQVELTSKNWNQANIEELPSKGKVTFAWGKRKARKLNVIRQKKVMAINTDQKIRREMIKEIEENYYADSTRFKETLTGVKYTFEEPVAPQPVAGNINGKPIFKEKITTEVVTDVPITTVPITINFVVKNNPAPAIDRMSFYQKYRMVKSPRIYIEGSVEPAICIRTLTIRQEQLASQSVLDTRSRGENARTFLSWKIRGGVQLDMSSSLYLDYSIMNQGFKTYHLIDWTTGLPGLPPTSRNYYHFKSHSLGLGYSYSPFRAKRASFTSDIGFVFNIANGGVSKDFKDLGLGSRLAAGIKLTVVPCFDIRIMPNWVANFQRLRKTGDVDSRLEVLGTKMQSFGLSVSARWFLMTNK